MIYAIIHLDFLYNPFPRTRRYSANVYFIDTILCDVNQDMVVGGTDTTSNTVEFAMAEMLNKLEVMRKSQQELDTVIGRTNTLEEPNIHKLPYLKAVFREVLRLHQVLPLMVPHCPSKSCTIGGYTIPKGVRVFVNVWAIHKDPSIVKTHQTSILGGF
ncbi:cytochrome P450 81E8-like [Camellia sinensis]|uniref:cytochrome P450 81E8-like n=1 Tax=Camellia sinensis TaxID=4442 RepID=UPI001036C058|nr:cytochrome P450 81E8-like [Camellia sinensis]